MAQYDTIVGLDIGTHSVKAAWVRKGTGRPVVTRTESISLPHTSSDTRTLLTPWLEKIGLKKFPCVLGLAGQKVMFQPFVLPPGDPRTEDQAASMEVVKFNEMASETMLYDLTRFSLNPVERRLLVAMARPSLVDDILSLADELELNIVDIVPTPVAIFNVLEAVSPPHDQPNIYASIGSSSTDLTVGSAAVGMMFARTFSSGGQTFTDTLSTALSIPRSRAETDKIEQGSLADDAPMSQPLRRAADLWVSEMQSSLSVYRGLFSERNAVPTGLVLTGGASQLPGFLEYIAERLDLPVTLAEGIKGLRTPMDMASYATATGLAVTAHRPDAVHISLLPERLRDELSFRRLKPYWIAAGVIAALILAVSLVGGYRDSKKMERHLGEQRASLQRRQSLVREIESIKAGCGLMERMADPLAHLLHAAPLTRNLITLVAESKDKNDQITMICDAASYFGDMPLRPPEDPLEAAANAARRRRKPDLEAEKKRLAVFEQVMIEGITLRHDLRTVKELIAAIDEADYVQSADLLSDDQIVDPDRRRIGKGRLFVIDIKIAKP